MADIEQPERRFNDYMDNRRRSVGICEAKSSRTNQPGEWRFTFA
jgi:hypothetical protein